MTSLRNNEDAGRAAMAVRGDYPTAINRSRTLQYSVTALLLLNLALAIALLVGGTA